MSPFKSITGRALGKLLEGYKSSDIGKGFGSGDGGTVATGGSILTIGAYTYHLFSSNGVFRANSAIDINYVVVGGGGGGGSGNTGNSANHYSGAGGGAGGVRIGTASLVGSSEHIIIVGDGGTGNNTSTAGPTPGFGNRGGDSSLGLSSPIIGSGGGAGENRDARSNGGQNQTAADNIMPGGSGGGAASQTGPAGSTVASPDGVSPTTQGYNGGTCGISQSAGGGGGAGGVGSPTPDANNGGPGGPGATTVFPGPGLYPLLPTAEASFLGTAWRDALGPTGLIGGGGGGAQGSSNFQSRGVGGPGGGGPASPTNAGAGESGVAGTGGGGGGGADQPNAGGPNRAGGAGGKGIVMIRYGSA